MKTKAILIGNSDGIGLAMTERLLAKGWQVIGISRSKSPLKKTGYNHHIADVSGSGFTKLLTRMVKEKTPDLCIYCAGIGELMDPMDMDKEVKVFEVNLLGMVKTASVVIPAMVKREQGHFIGISSLADELLSAKGPSYHASKAGFSNYLEGLALALKPRGVFVTNVRFGFVDTKMAKGDKKPLIMSVERAVIHVEMCMQKKPVRYSAPKTMLPLIKLRKFLMKLGAK